MGVHPPKFYDAALFLEEYLSCPGAVEAMSVLVIFSDAGDMAAFESRMAAFSPRVLESMNKTWTAIVSYPLPAFLAKMTKKVDEIPRNQKTSAFKKWFGVAHLLDHLPDSANYGLMLDADIRLFSHSDCGLGGRWSRLLSRIEGMEAKRRWLGISHVNRTSSEKGSEGAWGNSIRRRLLRVNAVWALGGSDKLDGKCDSQACKQLRWQVDNIFYTWWTDLPYVNLEVASRLLTFLGGGPTKLAEAGCSFRRLSQRLSYTPFEHFVYQQWCVLHEGYSFEDVSELVGSNATWGSYSEGPSPGSRIADLRPAWVSAISLAMAQKGEIPDLSPAEPLLLYHLDHKQAQGAAGSTRSEMQRRGVTR